MKNAYLQIDRLRADVSARPRARYSCKEEVLSKTQAHPGLPPKFQWKLDCDREHNGVRNEPRMASISVGQH